MINPFVLEIILEILKAIVGVVIPGITIYLAFYIKKFNEKQQLKSLQSRVEWLTSYSNQTRSFDIMDYESKVESIVASAMDYAIRNGISVHENEVRIMVENSLLDLKKMENTGLKLYRLKQNIGE